MWSGFHILFLLSPFILAIILFYFTRKHDSETNRKIGIILSVICIVLLILRNIEIFVKSGYKFQPEIFPLQICHFANFILLFAFLWRNKTMYAIAFCFNLPFAYLSILFANSLENYQTIINFRGAAYIFGHILIVGVAIWAYMLDLVRIERKSMIKGLIFLAVLFVLSVPINNLFNYLMPEYNSNYFYSLAPEGGTPLELAYSWGSVIKFLGLKFNPVYLFVTLIFGLGIYVIFGCLGKLLKSAQSKPKTYKTA